MRTHVSTLHCVDSPGQAVQQEMNTDAHTYSSQCDSFIMDNPVPTVLDEIRNVQQL